MLPAPRGKSLVLLAFAALLAAACGSGGIATPASPRTAATVAAPASAATVAAPVKGPVSAEVASGELVPGANRFLLGLLDASGKPIADATAHFVFYDLNGTQPVARGETDATFRAPAREANLPETIKVTQPDGQSRVQVNAPSDVGVYEATAVFDKPGKWGVQATGKLKDGTPYEARTGFEVAVQGKTPAIGSPAPRSHNPTVKDVSDLAQIDSSVHPSPDMHTESIADGIAAGHPELILFATPGYCSSRFCGPELELARKLEPKYAGRVDFIHVEIYKDPGQRIPADAVNEWHLPSEPWFFLVDSQGIVRAKFEGPTTIEELDAALQKMVS